MALCYRKSLNKVVDYVKLKMQLSALTLKISENNDKIDSLLTVDKNIIKDVSTNAIKIDTNENDISSNLDKINSIKNDTSTQIKSDIDEIKSNLVILILTRIINIQLKISLFIILEWKIVIKLVKTNLVFLYLNIL